MITLDPDLKMGERIVGEASEAWRMGCLCTMGKEMGISRRTTLLNETGCLGCTAAPSEVLWPCSGSLAQRQPCHQPGPGLTQAGPHCTPTACSWNDHGHQPTPFRVKYPLGELVLLKLGLRKQATDKNQKPKDKVKQNEIK